MRRRRAPGIALPAASLLLIVAVCVVGPVVLPVPAPVGGSVLDSGKPPLSPGHFLGTDANGNDVWARLVFGGRTSLAVAAAVNLLGLAVGGTLGALGGYTGGPTDAFIMRTLDVFIAFPSLVLVIAVARALGPGEGNTIIALACVCVPAFARVARSATLRVRAQPFMQAARLSGARAPRMLAAHLAPNILPQLAAYALLGTGAVMTLDGALSFVGFGVPLPQPTWGNMIFDGQQALLVTPVLVVVPGALLFVTVLSLNLLAEAARSRWNGR